MRQKQVADLAAMVVMEAPVAEWEDFKQRTILKYRKSLMG